ncbi:MAG: AAA family ATPase [Bradymonadales bacterium]
MREELKFHVTEQLRKKFEHTYPLTFYHGGIRDWLSLLAELPKDVPILSLYVYKYCLQFYHRAIFSAGDLWAISEGEYVHSEHYFFQTEIFDEVEKRSCDRNALAADAFERWFSAHENMIDYTDDLSFPRFTETYYGLDYLPTHIFGDSPNLTFDVENAYFDYLGILRESRVFFEAYLGKYTDDFFELLARLPKYIRYAGPPYLSRKIYHHENTAADLFVLMFFFEQSGFTLEDCFQDEFIAPSLYYDPYEEGFFREEELFHVREKELYPVSDYLALEIDKGNPRIIALCQKTIQNAINQLPSPMFISGIFKCQNSDLIEGLQNFLFTYQKIHESFESRSYMYFDFVDLTCYGRLENHIALLKIAAERDPEGYTSGHYSPFYDFPLFFKTGMYARPYRDVERMAKALVNNESRQAMLKSDDVVEHFYGLKVQYCHNGDKEMSCELARNSLKANDCRARTFADLAFLWESEEYKSVYAYLLQDIETAKLSAFFPVIPSYIKLENASWQCKQYALKAEPAIFFRAALALLTETMGIDYRAEIGSSLRRMIEELTSLESDLYNDDCDEISMIRDNGFFFSYLNMDATDAVELHFECLRKLLEHTGSIHAAEDYASFISALPVGLGTTPHNKNRVIYEMCLCAAILSERSRNEGFNYAQQAYHYLTQLEPATTLYERRLEILLPFVCLFPPRQETQQELLFDIITGVIKVSDAQYSVATFLLMSLSDFRKTLLPRLCNYYAVSPEKHHQNLTQNIVKYASDRDILHIVKCLFNSPKRRAKRAGLDILVGLLEYEHGNEEDLTENDGEYLIDEEHCHCDRTALIMGLFVEGKIKRPETILKQLVNANNSFGPEAQRFGLLVLSKIKARAKDGEDSKYSQGKNKRSAQRGHHDVNREKKKRKRFLASSSKGQADMDRDYITYLTTNTDEINKFFTKLIKNNLLSQSKAKSVLEKTTDSIFIDKTLLIDDILNAKPSLVLITRPEGFGKSTSLSMLSNFFDIRARDRSVENFRHLAISKSPHFARIGSSPVVFLDFQELDDFLDMSNFGSIDYAWYQGTAYEARSLNRHDFNYWSHRFLYKESCDNAVDHLFTRIIDLLYCCFVYELRYAEFSGFKKADLYTERIDIARRTKPNKDFLVWIFQLICELLYEQHGRKVILLIDNYDEPLRFAYNKSFDSRLYPYDRTYYQKVLERFRSFFAAILTNNPFLDFAVMTGVWHPSKESLFPSIDNIYVSSMLSTFAADKFGVTEDEYRKLLMSNNEHDEHGVETLESHCDSYTIGNKSRAVKVYNIESIKEVICLKHKSSQGIEYMKNIDYIDKYQVIARGFRKHMRSEHSLFEKLLNRESIKIKLNEQMLLETPDSGMSSEVFWNFLFFAGHLTPTVPLDQSDSHNTVEPNMELSVHMPKQYMKKYQGIIEHLAQENEEDDKL